MLPKNELSSVAIYGEFLAPDNVIPTDLEDRELGGIALNDPSQGLQYQVWRCFVAEDAPDEVKLEAESVPAQVVLTVPGIQELSFTFDQNMNFTATYKQNDICYLYWFDTSISDYTTTSFGEVFTPRVALDDKRKTQSSTSDIIFAYIRENSLYYRQQRDRYEVEYLLQAQVDGIIEQIGMTTENRFQFRMRPV